MATHYIGTLASGVVVGRKSTRSDFTHAAARPNYQRGNKLPAFGTSAEGAARNFVTGFGKDAVPEVVPVRIVTPAEYRAATA